MSKTSNQNLQSLVKILRNNFSTFLLGLTVLLIVILTVSILTGQNSNKQPKNSKSWTAGLAELFSGKKEPATPPESSVKTYQVKEGDSLWTIAQAAYGSGYNAVDIAQVNKLENPDIIEPGQNLVLPNIEPKEPTSGETVMGTATGKVAQRPQSYIVQIGDSLWKIAEQFYGDGYAWVRIAQANSLPDANFIYAGTQLLLP